MLKIINKTEEINRNLEKEGKISYIDPYDEQHIQATKRFYSELQRNRREFIRKSKLSEISASKVILNF